MIIYVFNKSLEVIGLIEDYYSLTWAERYYVCGDFELELPITYDGSPLIEFGNFLYISSSDRLMIIEDIKPSTGEDTTNLVVQGESAESLLKRRVVKYIYTFLDENAEQIIYDLIADNITAPGVTKRRISLFKTTFPTVSLTATFNQQLDILSVYDIVKNICKLNKYGFKVVKEDNKLAFSVYEGADRSYDQTTNPFVIFSDDFDNVIASSFYLSEKGKANVVFIYAADSLSVKPFRIWHYRPYEAEYEPEDLDRFEVGLVTDVDPNPSEGPELVNTDMIYILQTRGDVILEENKTVGVFEGDFDIQGNFKYGVDFFMGDIVQCRLEGRNIKARIIELVQSYSTEGETSYVAMDFISTE